MMDEFEESKRTGTFTISPGKDVYGELTFKGPETSLHLHDKASFSTHAIPEQCITGILQDLTKVSLIQCITPPVPGSGRRGNEEYYFANIFPHYVVRGDHHITPVAKSITSVHFVVDDATTLFYDFDAFGSLIDARPFIKDISRANAHHREITTGPNPAILYYTGKREIFGADTLFGRISASHNPSHNLGGPDGVYLKNTIHVNLTFKEARAFDDAILHTFTLVQYLGILVGRPQNVLEVKVGIESDEERPVVLEVYWSMPPKRESSHEQRKPHPADVLLDAVRQPEAFSGVLGSWLDRQQTWRDARHRLFNAFAKQQTYDIDRLIGSANMFDILPSSAVAAELLLTEELKAAKETCREIFNRLPPSPERDSVLGALGRLGKSNLKQKIRHRARLITDAAGNLFPELVTVTDEAVNCRNHYVHGSDARFDYSDASDNFDAVVFFTDTLEFVFATSDLIEAGWDIRAWSEIGTAMSHPFGAYRVNYAASLQKLKALLPRPATAVPTHG